MKRIVDTMQTKTLWEPIKKPIKNKMFWYHETILL
jgi:hypothetical protein